MFWRLHKRSSRFFLAHVKIKELVKCVVSSGLNILKAVHADFERSLVLISYTFLEWNTMAGTYTPAFKGDQTHSESEIIWLFSDIEHVPYN